MKLLRLTESDLHNILKHSVKNVLREIYAYNNRTSLNEDKAGKREAQARKILKNKGLTDDQVLQVYNELRETFTFLRSKEGVIFFPLIARYYAEGSVKNATAITDLNQTCQYILNNPKLYEKYDSLINGDPSLVNLNFYELFDPKKDGIMSFDEKVTDAIKKLKNGTDSYEIFDGVGEFHDGFAGVILDHKCNFIDTKGNLLSKNQWFDHVGFFEDDFARVELDDKWNFIDTKGNLISNQWFDHVGFFKDGFVQVKLNDKWYLLDTKGQLHPYNG